VNESSSKYHCIKHTKAGKSNGDRLLITYASGIILDPDFSNMYYNLSVMCGYAQALQAMFE